ncbi:MAG: hypothetical protein WBG86_02140 [Polyangiales bacterium]
MQSSTNEIEKVSARGWACALCVSLLFASAGVAQAQPDDDGPIERRNENAAPSDDDVGSPSDPDPLPEVPEVDLNLERQSRAGIGGDIAYAEKGVVELGGGFLVDTSKGGTFISFRPSAGFFIVDNFLLSAIVELGWSNPDGVDSFLTFGGFIEPSFHFPFSDRVLGFVGLGVGGTYNNQDGGFALRPRIGTDILIGRSGIFRPAIEMTWSTADVV